MRTWLDFAVALIFAGLTALAWLGCWIFVVAALWLRAKLRLPETWATIQLRRIAAAFSRRWELWDCPHPSFRPAPDGSATCRVCGGYRKPGAEPYESAFVRPALDTIAGKAATGQSAQRSHESRRHGRGGT